MVILVPGIRWKRGASFGARSPRRQPTEYNRNVKRPFLAATALCLSIASLIGCGKNIDNKEAVRQGVVNYLAKRPDFLAMDVSVTSVAFRQDEATANVHLPGER